MNTTNKASETFLRKVSLNSIMGANISTSIVAAFASGAFVGATALYILIRKTEPNTVPISERFKFPILNDEYRLVLGVRNDLKMQKGKVAAQCGHAAVAAYAGAQKKKPDILQNWMRFGGTKITVKVESEEELMALNKMAKSMDVLSHVVRDAGQTQVAPGSRTVIAIGPAPKSVLDQISGHLKLY